MQKSHLIQTLSVALKYQFWLSRKTFSNMKTFDELPAELLLLIFGNLNSIDDVYALSHTSKLFHALVSTDNNLLRILRPVIVSPLRPPCYHSTDKLVHFTYSLPCHPAGALHLREPADQRPLSKSMLNTTLTKKLTRVNHHQILPCNCSRPHRCPAPINS